MFNRYRTSGSKGLCFNIIIIKYFRKNSKINDSRKSC